MDIKIGDILELKKKHPCGGDRFEVMRVGMDFRIKCLSCNAELWISRGKLEKRVKSVIQL